MKNFVVWFDIPVKKLDRAIKFYSSVFGIDLMPMDMGPDKMALFPFKPGIASGALVESKSASPSAKGSLVYLDGGRDLNIPLGRVSKAGGSVIQEKTSLGPNGFKAVFEDTEGNRVALHSMN